MPKLRVTLCLAVTDPPRMAATVTVCAALGICEIQPVISDRVDDSDIEHWLRNVTNRESIAGGTLTYYLSTVKAKTLPMANMLDAIRSLAEEGAQVVVLWEEATEPTLVEIVESLKQGMGGLEHIAIVVGPRLGLTQSEVSDAVSNGARIATIGSTVIGNHIAAIAGLMAIEHTMRH